ncbi:hypothetical protein KM043_006630 [Ampulex compressa]|nr:hypothetical protein KM043_006630 [Ampulex compressa]
MNDRGSFDTPFWGPNPLPVQVLSQEYEVYGILFLLEYKVLLIVQRISRSGIRSGRLLKRAHWKGRRPLGGWCRRASICRISRPSSRQLGPRKGEAVDRGDSLP